MCLLCLPAVVGTLGGFVEPPLLVNEQHSLAESQSRLPCHYQVETGEIVVQVSWFKQLPDGKKEQLITAHYTEGQTGKLQQLLRLRVCVSVGLCVCLWFEFTVWTTGVTSIAEPQVQQQVGF